MAKPIPAKKPTVDKYIGKRVRIRCEGEAHSHYAAGPTAPERIGVIIGGIITVVPVENVEVLG
jgi:hypothetical protein